MVTFKYGRLFFRMKRIILILFFSVSFLMARKIVIKMATLAPEGTEVYGVLLEIGQEWKNITKGKVQVKIYPGGIVGDERDMVRKMRIGQIHGAAMTSEGLSEIVPEFAGFFIPLIFQTYDDINKVKIGLLPKLKRKMNEGGFELINLNDFGWVHWFSKEKIKTPEDLKRQKFFTWAGDFRWEQIWVEAGYNPVPLASTDILSGLQTGLINTIPTMPIFALSQQSFGIANKMLDLKWGIVVAGIIVDSKIWNKIPKKYHNEMISVANEILLKNQNTNRASEKEAMEVMVENGLQIYKPTQKELNLWKEEVKKFESLLTKEVIPIDIYQEVIKLIKN